MNPTKCNPPSDLLETVGLVNSSTIIKLDTTSLSGAAVPRLPPLMSQLDYYRATSTQEAPATDTRNRQTVVPHPDHESLVQALDLPSEMTSEDRILHVVGTQEDHDLVVAVEQAAQQLGRTCWSVKGLAAMAHRLGRPVRTGGTADQVAGLEALLECIRDWRLAPCLLHLYDMEEEWVHFPDDSSRDDLQGRLWSKLMEALEEAATDISNAPTKAYPLIVVLSTRTPLPSCQWLKSLVFPSFSLSLPDRDYIQFLWKTSPLLSEDVLKLLQGRGTGEILRIQRRLRHPSRTSEIDHLRDICQELDIQRRRRTSAVATVANVHWEDVGGLDHVRREIMDAIELPLKYPHLFPNNQGRSGILLYGTYEPFLCLVT